MGKAPQWCLFDDYPDYATTKDDAHRQRNLKSKGSANVKVECNAAVKLTRDKFLGNKANAQQFIDLLTPYLQSAGCVVHRAAADADTVIVDKVLESADSRDTICVGDDTDLLIPLLAHNRATHNVYILPSMRKPTKQKNKNMAHSTNTTIAWRGCMSKHSMASCIYRL